jgi:hypothetical protein
MTRRMTRLGAARMLSAVDGRPDDLELFGFVMARQRRQGDDFETAWSVAMTALDRPTKDWRDAEAHGATLSALEATRAWWRAAYLNAPAPPAPHGRAAVTARLRAMQHLVAA